MILWRQEVLSPRLFSLKSEVARAKKLLKAKKFLTPKFQNPIQAIRDERTRKRFKLSKVLSKPGYSLTELHFFVPVSPDQLKSC